MPNTLGIFATDHVSNPHSYQEYAKYKMQRKLCKPIGFALTNIGSKLLANVQLKIKTPIKDKLTIIDKFDYDKKPQYSCIFRPSSTRPFFPRVIINRYGNNWDILVKFGNVQPKDTKWSNVFYIGYPKECSIEFEGLIYGDNIPEPIKVTFAVSIKIKHQPMTIEKLIELADKARK